MWCDYCHWYSPIRSNSTALVTYCLIGGIIGLVVMISVTIPLLIAASKNSRLGLLLPWLIFNFITVVLGIGLGLFASIYFMKRKWIQVEGGSVSIAVTLLGSGEYVERLTLERNKFNSFFFFVNLLQDFTSTFGWSSTATINN